MFVGMIFVAEVYIVLVSLFDIYIYFYAGRYVHVNWFTKCLGYLYMFTVVDIRM